MARDARVLVAIAGEDQAHRVLATALVDEVVLERAGGGWPEREELSQARVFALRTPRPHVLIGMRDTNDPNLSEQADRAVRHIGEQLDPEMIVIFGLPYRDAEAWFIAGLAPAPDRSAAARKALGFDPCDEPHRLTAEPNTALTDAKRVLRFLLGEGRTLEEAPSVAAPDPASLAERTLRDLHRLDRAVITGLSPFLARLRSEVASLVRPGR